MFYLKNYLKLIKINLQIKSNTNLFLVLHGNLHMSQLNIKKKEN